jgi:hypothetical protein
MEDLDLDGRNNIKMDLREKGSGGVDWINPASSGGLL